jgi:hypothetical protein
VYIYHGCLEGVTHRPAQIIQAEHIDPLIKGFGVSLSNAVDVDGNYYTGMYIYALGVNTFRNGRNRT